MSDFEKWFETNRGESEYDTAQKAYLAGKAAQREIDAELVEDFVCEHSHYRAGQRIREQSE